MVRISSLGKAIGNNLELTLTKEVKMFRLEGSKSDYHSVFEVQIKADSFVEAWDKAANILSIIDLKEVNSIKLSLIEDKKDEQ